MLTTIHKLGETVDEGELPSESGGEEVKLQAAGNKPLRAGGSGGGADKQLKGGEGRRGRSVVEDGDVEMHGM